MSEVKVFPIARSLLLIFWYIFCEWERKSLEYSRHPKGYSQTLENGFVRDGKGEEVESTELQGEVDRVRCVYFQVWFPRGQLYFLFVFYL